jgi:uncharacterized membrane protein YbaN (DUF454 family)
VKSTSPGKTSATKPSGQPGNPAGPFSLDIELDEEQGRVRVYDPRVFHEGRRVFCRRLLEATAKHPGVRRTEIDLESASCRIDFAPGPGMSRALAHAFADAVREAASASSRAAWWRPSPGWSRLTAYSRDGDVSVWETQPVKPGRVRLRHRMQKGDPAPLAPLADALAGNADVRHCRVSFGSRSIVVDYRPGSPIADRITDVLERALGETTAAGISWGESMALAIPSAHGEPVEVATGFRRFGYLALAGGSFALTLAALVVPGLPTVPCLLATSYYLARSSPTLDRMLRQSPFFGTILSEWEQHRALSWPSKSKLVGMTVVIIAVTAALTPLSPVAVAVVLVIAAISILGVLRLPALDEDANGAIRLRAPAPRALAAP